MWSERRAQSTKKEKREETGCAADEIVQFHVGETVTSLQKVRQSQGRDRISRPSPDASSAVCGTQHASAFLHAALPTIVGEAVVQQVTLGPGCSEVILYTTLLGGARSSSSEAAQALCLPQSLEPCTATSAKYSGMHPC
eukprot:4565154-Pleurochrysis_carterae.AAC.1